MSVKNNQINVAFGAVCTVACTTERFYGPHVTKRAPNSVVHSEYSLHTLLKCTGRELWPFWVPHKLMHEYPLSISGPCIITVWHGLSEPGSGIALRSYMADES